MALRLVVHGLVQGVGYRESMRREAKRLHIRGWVRNRFDGTVEALIDGDDAAIAAMIEWARRGPPAARVTNLVSEPAPALDHSHQGFEHRATQ